MKNALKFFVMLVLVSVVATSCKTKQKITEISGANVPATETKTSVPDNSVSATDTKTVNTPVSAVTETEVTRNESFTLSEGDATSLKFKYHVVVGSFKNQANAKGLQSTLLNEGNKALVVVNEQGWYRVLIASFNDYAQAHIKIDQIKGRFADAWVLVQKQ